MIKVLLADDQELIRQSLSFVMSRQEDIEMVGTAANGCEALELVEEKQHRRRISLYFPDINAFRDSLFAGKLLRHYNSVNANIRNSLSICQKFDLFLDIRNRIGTYKISVSLQF